MKNLVLNREIQIFYKLYNNQHNIIPLKGFVEANLNPTWPCKKPSKKASKKKEENPLFQVRKNQLTTEAERMHDHHAWSCQPGVAYGPATQPWSPSAWSCALPYCFSWFYRTLSDLYCSLNALSKPSFLLKLKDFSQK